jgi:glycosyltransferase involved in cell wall biosynthesis
MRVLFAMRSVYLPHWIGGMQVSTDALCKALIRSGFDARVFCGVYTGWPFDIARRGLKKFIGRDLLGRNFARDLSCGYPVYRARDAVAAAKEAAASIMPDVVVVQSWAAHELAKPFLMARIPTIIYVHTLQPFIIDDEMRHSRCFYCIAISHFAATQYRDKGISRIVPPLIEKHHFRVESTREAVLFINPIVEKGLDIAVDLARHRPDVSFDFFESWRLKRKQKRHARYLTNALPNVRWHSATTDTRQAYRRARLVLIPSVTETWGRVASEGHISGIPTLGSNRGALPETIGPAGICVDFEAPREVWHRAFSEIWDSAESYARFSAAAEKFSLRPEIQPDNVIASFIDLLQSIVAQ